MKKNILFSIVILLVFSVNSVKATTKTICTAATTTLSATSLSGTWSSSNTSIATVNASGVVTGVSAGNVTITYTNNSLLGIVFGLLGSPTITTTTITVVGVPTSVTATATPGAICAGSTLTLTGSATGATSYSWSAPGGAAIVSVTSENTSVSAVTAANAGVYTLSATNVCGTAKATSSAVVVTASAPTSVTASTVSNTVCSGTMLTLNGNATGAVSYLWKGPGITTTNTQNISINTVTTANAGTYTLSATNICGTTSSTTTINVNQSPVVSGSVSNITCNGYSNGDVILGNILISVSGGSGSYSTVWSTGNTSTYGIFGLSAGGYSVTVTDGNGCATTQSFAVTQPSPITGVVAITNSGTGDNAGVIDFSVTGGTAPYNYIWSNGATTQDMSGLSHGDYCVAVSDANSCGFNDCYYVNSASGTARHSSHGSSDSSGSVNSLPIDIRMGAYPNPFTSKTNITFSVPADGHTTIEVFNAVNGQRSATVFNDETKAGNEYSCIIDGENLSSGTYIYRVTSAGSSYVGRVTLVK